MNEDNIVRLHVADGDPLQGIVRYGAWRLLTQAIYAETDGLLDLQADRCHATSKLPDSVKGSNDIISLRF